MIFLFAVAHSHIYGYGFRTYEFQPHVKFTKTSDLSDHVQNLSTVKTNQTSQGKVNAAISQEVDLGMYAMRSWMYPRVYMIVFKVMDRIDIRLSHLKVSLVLSDKRLFTLSDIYSYQSLLN